MSSFGPLVTGGIGRETGRSSGLQTAFQAFDGALQLTCVVRGIIQNCRPWTRLSV